MWDRKAWYRDEIWFGYFWYGWNHFKHTGGSGGQPECNTASFPLSGAYDRGGMLLCGKRNPSVDRERCSEGAWDFRDWQGSCIFYDILSGALCRQDKAIWRHSWDDTEAAGSRDQDSRRIQQSGLCGKGAGRAVFWGNVWCGSRRTWGHS